MDKTKKTILDYLLFTAEYYRVKINNVEKIILLHRKKEDVNPETDNPILNAKLWIIKTNIVMNKLFNTNEWEYLGDIDNFTPEKGTNIMLIAETTE